MKTVRLYSIDADALPLIGATSLPRDHQCMVFANYSGIQSFMQTVREQTLIHAPLERCFALSTRVELVRFTLGMEPAGGVTTGHVQAGSRVRWRGWKFGLPTEHHTLITAFEAPHPQSEGRPQDAAALCAFFQDTQESGRFQAFQHDHHFRQQGPNAATLLADEVRFSLPIWMGGILAERVLLAPYIRRLTRQRFRMLKKLAEGDGWRRWEMPVSSASLQYASNHAEVAE